MVFQNSDDERDLHLWETFGDFGNRWTLWMCR